MTRWTSVVLAALALLGLSRAFHYEQAASALPERTAVSTSYGGTVRSGSALSSGRAPMAAIGGTARPDSPSHVGVWTRMADCESGDGDGRAPYTASWHYDGYHDGGLQFLPATWNMAKRLPSVRAFASRYAYAHHAPAWVQIRVADNWRRHTSWLQWPTCSRKLGLL